ncbi:hypothetical protein ACYJW8_11825 [Frateuria aurantia]
MKVTDRWVQGTAWTIAARSLRRQQVIPVIRIVLGGLLMPLGAAAWLKRIALLLLPIGVISGIFMSRDASLGQAWDRGAGCLAALWCQLLSLGVVGMAALQLRHHWRRSQHGLSSLALLPGLGHGPQIHRDLLSAAIVPLLRWLLVLGLIQLLASITASRGALAALLVFANVFGNALTLITLALYTFSGRALPATALGLILTSLSALSLLGFGLPDWLSHGSMVAAAAGIPFFGLLWVSHYGAMAWMVLMGWANLFDRPHPFLPNP